MQGRERGSLLARQGDAVAHQCRGNPAAPPGGMHRNRGDSPRRYRPPAEELTGREEHVPTDHLAFGVRQPERRVRLGGGQPAHVVRGSTGERLRVDLGEAPELGLTLRVANLDR